MAKTLPGGMDAAEFLRDYWQKKPLLIRDAFPGFTGFLTPEELAGLALEPDVEARIVRQTRTGWTLKRGPFEERDFTSLPKTRWTVLVQGVNLYLPEARELLDRFNFIPHARLDDLMVSYAPKDGGVGPHLDSYDVFLLQGQGHRRWRVSAQDDHAFLPDQPLRVLARFEPEEEFVLGPGDMLYLPPKYAHEGVALDDCMTWSVGFRAPTAQELAEQFLSWFAGQVHAEGIYADPDLQPTGNPGKIDAAMARRIGEMLAGIRWEEADIGRFLGQYLSEPKANIRFQPPGRPLSEARFRAAAEERGLALSLASQALYDDGRFFINGEEFEAAPDALAWLRPLADAGRRPPAPLLAALVKPLHLWYKAGWINAGLIRG